jgi:hypothetical protein
MVFKGSNTQDHLLCGELIFRLVTLTFLFYWLISFQSQLSKLYLVLCCWHFIFKFGLCIIIKDALKSILSFFIFCFSFWSLIIWKFLVHHMLALFCNVFIPFMFFSNFFRKCHWLSIDFKTCSKCGGWS